MLANIAWAQAQSGPGGTEGTLLSLVPFVLIFVIFYFLLILPQRKRSKEVKKMQDDLKKGDKILTSSGIWGTITNLGKTSVTVQISDNTKVRMQREAVTRLRSDEEE
jgi:preprotein translocase subunit YajC